MSLRSLFCLFLSSRFTQVLLYLVGHANKLHIPMPRDIGTLIQKKKALKEFYLYGHCNYLDKSPSQHGIALGCFIQWMFHMKLDFNKSLVGSVKNTVEIY